MKGRHEALRAKALRPLTLVVRGARTTAIATILFALLTAVTTAYLVATPRLQATAYDKALGDELHSATQLQRDVTLSLTPQDNGQFVGMEMPDEPLEGLSAPFDTVNSAAQSAMGPDAALVGTPLVSAQTDAFAIAPETGASLSGPPQAVVRVQGDLDQAVTWTTGRAPGAPTQTRVLTLGKQKRRVHLMPVGVAEAVATELGLKVGASYRLTPAGESQQRGREPIFVTLAGTFAPRNPRSAIWETEPRLLGVASIPSAQGGAVRQGAFVLPIASYSALTDSLRAWSLADLAPMGSPLLTHTWRYSVRDDLVRADAPRLARMASRLDVSADMTRLPERPRLTTDLPSLVERYERSLASTSVVTSFATTGLTALAALVLMLTALVATAGRLRELALLSARGASKPRVVAMALAGPMFWGVAAAVLAAAVTLLVVPGATPWLSWVQVALLVIAPAMAITALVVSNVRGAASADAAAATSLVRSGRRIVAELALVVLAVLAVSTVRARGDVIAGGQTDWYAALSPVLVAAAAAVVVFRLFPAPIRMLSRLAGRGRGYVTFLGLARSSRASGSAGLPLLALVVGASVITVVATIAATISDERSLASFQSVGADVRVDGVRIDQADLDGLKRRAGVSAVSGAYVDGDAQIAGDIVSTGKRAQDITVIGVDPADYSAVVAGTPMESGGARPAVPAGRLAVQLSGGASVGDEIELVVRGTHLPATVTVVDPGLARIFAGRLVTTAFVPLNGLEAKVPAAQRNTAYVKASPQAQAALVKAGADDLNSLGELVTGVTSAKGVADGAARRALPTFVAQTYALAAGLAGVLTFLTVVLLLVAGRPERRHLLLRLRTMGMPRRAEVRLLAVEVLPLLFTAVLVGAAVGIAAPLLVSSAIDLSGYTAGPRPELSPSWLTGGLAALAALLLAVLALVVEEIRTRRASLTEHLRAGDTA